MLSSLLVIKNKLSFNSAKYFTGYKICSVTVLSVCLKKQTFFPFRVSWTLFDPIPTHFFVNFLNDNHTLHQICQVEQGTWVANHHRSGEGGVPDPANLYGLCTSGHPLIIIHMLIVSYKGSLCCHHQDTHGQKHIGIWWFLCSLIIFPHCNNVMVRKLWSSP